MERLPNDQFTSDFASLTRLVSEQQRAIRELIEDVIKDIDSLKHLGESIAVIKSKLETFDKEFESEKRIRAECQARCDRNFSEITQKRELIHSKIADIDKNINDRIYAQYDKLRNELENKIDSKINKLGDAIKDVKDKELKTIQDKVDNLVKTTSYEAGKYGGIVSIIIMLIMFVIKALWEHIKSGK